MSLKFTHALFYKQLRQSKFYKTTFAEQKTIGPSMQGRPSADAAALGPAPWCLGKLFIFSVYWAQWHHNATAQRGPAPRVCIGPRIF